MLVRLPNCRAVRPLSLINGAFCLFSLIICQTRDHPDQAYPGSVLQQLTTSNRLIRGRIRSLHCL
jgi:hypothetical protein